MPPTPGEEDNLKTIEFGTIAPKELTVARFTFVTAAPLPAKLPVNWLAVLLNTTAPVNTESLSSRATLAESWLSEIAPVTWPAVIA